VKFVTLKADKCGIINHIWHSNLLHKVPINDAYLQVLLKLTQQVLRVAYQKVCYHLVLYYLVKSPSLYRKGQLVLFKHL